MATQRAPNEDSNWIEVGDSGDKRWQCATCGLVLGGKPIASPPRRCPVCAAADGDVVAVVARRPDDSRVSMLVLDREFRRLIDSYRDARSDASRDDRAHAVIAGAGGYDLDGVGSESSIDRDASRAHEQRSALALADGILDRASAPSPKRRDSHA